VQNEQVELWPAGFEKRQAERVGNKLYMPSGLTDVQLREHLQPYDDIRVPLLFDNCTANRGMTI
jgi:hypothetical protein